MLTLRLNGTEVKAEDWWTLLETSRFYGIDIPTLCYHEGLSPWGGCRLCIVEIGEGENTKLVSSCTYPVTQGLNVRTHSRKVIAARKVIVELLLSTCPSSKTVQDLASALGVQKVRFKGENDDCIYCGLCVRMCAEQMNGRAIGFVNRGGKLKITTPFDRQSEVCRHCGACMYICPACQLRCQGSSAPGVVCGSCMRLEPTCVEYYPDQMCYMGAAGDCGTCVREAKKG
ncbi:MAG: 2Fe-2S iron-sulfur cluster-binding protein [Dehalococcoidales bacterium]|nr:2Fe-2S iron-sulfur cluster-binding protein [Dehalococcoidales bacterium]